MPSYDLRLTRWPVGSTQADPPFDRNNQQAANRRDAVWKAMLWILDSQIANETDNAIMLLFDADERSGKIVVEPAQDSTGGHPYRMYKIEFQDLL